MPRRLIHICALTIAVALLALLIVAVPARSLPQPPIAAASVVPAYSGPTTNTRAELVRALTIKAENDARWFAWFAAHPEPKTEVPGSRIANRVAVYGEGACGGDLPPCSVMMCESGGSLTAHNGSGADGKWQIMPRTWDTSDSNGDGHLDSYQGADGVYYDNPSDAPESVQDARAAEVYAGGAGRRAWVC